MGKNLSCLRRKTSKNTKKAKKAMEKKYTFVPVDLLPLEGEEKGDVFYDTRGESVGNKGDYTLNKCRVTTSGWLLLPTISPDLIPSPSLRPDYTMETNCVEEEDDMCHSDDVDIAPSTPSDEGYPTSSGYSSSPPSAPSSQTPLSQPSDDELGLMTCTPTDSPSQPESNSEEPMECVESTSDQTPDGIENIPLDSLPEDSDLATRPVRRSMRQALKLCQLEQEEGSQNPPEEGAQVPQEKEEEILIVKRAIQKKKTCNLPSKLRTSSDENTAINPASDFCARTFFCMDKKILKHNLLSFQCAAFENNSKLCKKLMDHIDILKSANRSKKKAVESDDPKDDFIDIEGFDDTETLKSADPENDIVRSPLEDADIVFSNEVVMSPSNTLSGHDPIGAEGGLPAVDLRNDVAMSENVALDLSDVVHDDSDDGCDTAGETDYEKEEEQFVATSKKIVAEFMREIQSYMPSTDIADKVHEWEESVKPFLNDLDTRESFDINLYGSSILNSFEDSNRKQTITFRNLCRGKEKFEVHRNFMALLPLVNIGNVSIEKEETIDGEDIMVTLLSRKMHHKELEEFGHSDGEHS